MLDVFFDQLEREEAQQSLARTSAMLQSLRQQLDTAEGEKRSNQHTHSHFQGEIGRLKSKLIEKVGQAMVLLSSIYAYLTLM